MKRVVLCAVMGLAMAGTLAPAALMGQASEIPSAAPAPPKGQTQEERGRTLLDEMVTALGGQAWLDRKDMQEKGHVAAFFRGEPTGSVVDYVAMRQFPDATHKEAERIGFLSDRSMILPGKKIDVVHIWIDGNGYEVTYKGRTPLPKDQVEDYYRRRDHSIENVVRVWLKAPGVMVLSEGTTMVERHLADKVTVLSANNDAVTLELDTTTHLPLRRKFEWRNATFKDRDEDAEEYDDYHSEQGLPTPFSITRFHNGDMTEQRFITKGVQYNVGLPPDTFDLEKLVKTK